jgi:hypothetical protein
MAKYSDKQMGKEVGSADVYAPPHTMSGKAVGISSNPGRRTAKLDKNPDWTPMDGVSIGRNDEVKTTGIKMRGTGCATKGVMSRGPMG